MADPFEAALGSIVTNLGEPVVFKGDGDLNVALTGVFKDTFTILDPATGLQVVSSEITLLVKRSDLPFKPMYRQKFTIRGEDYIVSKVEKDSEDGLLVFLHEAPQASEDDSETPPDEEPPSEDPPEQGEE